MASPLTAERLVAALKAEGVRVVEYKNWRTHNRNQMGPWGPVHGVMIHHTVTSGTGASVALCYNGHAGLPGPLCHGVIAKDGSVHLVGNGRANHAGLGDGDVLEAVIRERPIPGRNEADTDGNARFYGFECVNLGDNKDPWPAAQVEGIVRASAALCRAHGWGKSGDTSVIGHLEWQPGKVDPRGPGISMSDVRKRVAERLKHSADWNPGGDDVPKFVNLGTKDRFVAKPHKWDAIEFTREWEDEAGHHGEDGSQFVKGPSKFSGVVYLSLRGLPKGEVAQVRLSEVKDGEYVQDHPIVEVIGTGGDTFGELPFAQSVTKGRGVRVRIKVMSDSEVSVNAVLKSFTW